MEELTGFSDIVLQSKASRYQGVYVSSFSMYVHELLSTKFDSVIAPHNTKKIDEDFFSQKMVSYFRGKTGRLIEAGFILSPYKH